ncbi:MAG: exosome complex RNA-binding protein Csl4, partial [Methanimicrococcus sp.]|nr:exosome complex RNA-binding protein Csl4 [Methanimicrococcus sp.]
RDMPEQTVEVEVKHESVAVTERASKIPRKPRPEITVNPDIEKHIKKELPPREERTREERPAFREERTREERPAFREERTREERPAFREERTREERPAFREERTREERPAFREERTRDGRPAFREDRFPAHTEFENGRKEGSGKFEKRDRSGKFGKDRRDVKGGKKFEKKKRPEKMVFEKTKQFVFPGEAVGVIEEYKPGFGTINDDGTIRATVPGVVGTNNEHRIITVIPKAKTPNVITEGDIVIASITDIRESNARVEIVAAEKSLDEEIVNNGNAEIYISNIKDGYAKTVSDEFCINDIVRAKVIDSSKIGLSTVDSHLGVLKAYCTKCKTNLVRNENILICPHCGNREHRKLAEGYGKGIASSI